MWHERIHCQEKKKKKENKENTGKKPQKHPTQKAATKKTLAPQTVFAYIMPVLFLLS